MLKEEFRKYIENMPEKGNLHSVSILLKEYDYDEVKSAAKECGCSLAEYFRRCHRFAQQTDAIEPDKEK